MCLTPSQEPARSLPKKTLLSHNPFFPDFVQGDAYNSGTQDPFKTYRQDLLDFNNASGAAVSGPPTGYIFAALLDLKCNAECRKTNPCLRIFISIQKFISRTDTNILGAS